MISVPITAFNPVRNLVIRQQKLDSSFHRRPNPELHPQYLSYNDVQYYTVELFPVPNIQCYINKDGSQRIGLLESCHYSTLLTTITFVQLLFFQIKLVHKKIMLGNTEVSFTRLTRRAYCEISGDI